MADKSKYYAYLPKDGSRGSFKTISTASFASSLPGDELVSYYPYSSSIDVKYFYSLGSEESNLVRKEIYSLENALNRHKIFSPHFAYSSSLGNKATQALTLISIPSIFFGSSIDKGSVELTFCVSGTVIAKLEDIKKNGELVETTGSNTGSVAGVVLYNHGFIILTGSWNLDSNFTEVYRYSPTLQSAENPKWIYWGAGYNLTGSSNYTISSSFDINFNGVNYIPTLTMMAHAEKGDLNHSNNPTYVKYGEPTKSLIVTSSNNYYEPSNLEIKNVTKYAFENYSGSLEKQTYITKIGIYDEKRNLIAIAKLSKPVKKTESRDFTFKLKLDL
jgi:hypothetical protein